VVPGDGDGGGAGTDFGWRTVSLEHLRMLVVTGNRNRDDLVKTLEEKGRAIVDILPVYRTELADLAKEPAAQAFRESGADAIAFHEFVDGGVVCEAGAATATGGGGAAAGGVRDRAADGGGVAGARAGGGSGSAGTFVGRAGRSSTGAIVKIPVNNAGVEA